MKNATLTLILFLAALPVVAGDAHKSCDMNKHTEKSVSMTGKVSCKGNDCSFQTAVEKASYTLCEMSKADLPKLSQSGTTVKVTGKLITCEGKEKLQITKVASK